MDHKEIIRRYFHEKWNERNADVLTEVLSPDFAFRGPALEASSREEYQRIYAALTDALTETSVTVEDLIEEGDKVVSRVVVSGVHSGELLGVAASGRSFTFTVVTIFRFQDDRIAEELQMYDSLELLTQLGMVVVPA